MLTQESIAAPARDCVLCPRLAAYRAANQAAQPRWFNGPVPSFGRHRRGFWWWEWHPA